MAEVEMRLSSASSTTPPTSSSLVAVELELTSTIILKFQHLCSSFSSILPVPIFAGIYNGSHGTTWWWLTLLYFWLNKFGHYKPQISTEEISKLDMEKKKILLPALISVILSLVLLLLSLLISALADVTQRTGNFVNLISFLLLITTTVFLKVATAEINHLEQTSHADFALPDDEDPDDLRPRSTRLDNMIHCHELPCNRCANFLQRSTRYFCRCLRISCRSGKFHSLLVLLTISSSLTIVINQLQWAVFSPPGMLVDIGDADFSISWTKSMYRRRNLHLHCEGEIVSDSPVVWFEHGWLGSSLDWRLVRNVMKTKTRVCR